MINYNKQPVQCVTLRPKPGVDNTRFVEMRLKKLKKVQMNDKQMKQTFYPQFFTKPSKLRHDKLCKRIHIREKYGV